jgi:hypothetical protein
VHLCHCLCHCAMGRCKPTARLARCRGSITRQWVAGVDVGLLVGADPDLAEGSGVSVVTATPLHPA